jgi:Fe2+ or Zn2+ uptake regulation protein
MQPSNIERTIMSYMLDHPEARDTLEGIAEWWIPSQEIKIQIQNVKHALSNLVEAGFILEKTMSDGRVHYRINQMKIHHISALIETEGI